jgi:glycine reductase
LPLHIMRQLEDAGVYKSLYPWFFTTSGVGTAVADSKRMGVQIATEMKRAGVVGCILVAT